MYRLLCGLQIASHCIALDHQDFPEHWRIAAELVPDKVNPLDWTAIGVYSCRLPRPESIVSGCRRCALLP